MKEWLFKRFICKTVDTVFKQALKFSTSNQFSVSFPKYMFCSIKVYSPKPGSLTLDKAPI